MDDDVDVLLLRCDDEVMDELQYIRVNEDSV